MKKLLTATALAVTIAVGIEGVTASPANAKTFVYNPPICFPLELRQNWIDAGFEVVETVTRPGVDIPDVVTWEAWINESLDVYGMTGRTDERICVYEEGRGTKPPAIHDRISNSQPKHSQPQGTAL